MRFIITFVLLCILIAGCTADCSRLLIRKDRCYLDLAQENMDEFEKSIYYCGQVKDELMRDSCFLNLFDNSFTTSPDEELRQICDSIENSDLRGSCNRKIERPHLKGYVG